MNVMYRYVHSYIHTYYTRCSSSRVVVPVLPVQVHKKVYNTHVTFFIDIFLNSTVDTLNYYIIYYNYIHLNLYTVSGYRSFTYVHLVHVVLFNNTQGCSDPYDVLLKFSFFHSQCCGPIAFLPEILTSWTEKTQDQCNFHLPRLQQLLHENVVLHIYLYTVPS